MKHNLLLLLMALFVFPVLAEETLEFTATEDSMVKKSYPSKNYGNVSYMEANGSNLAESFIKFKVQGITKSISKAMIRLYVTNGSSDGPAVFAVPNDWKEHSITYSNKPPRISNELDKLGNVSPKQYVDIDVTSFVKDNGTFSFNIVSFSNDGALFATRNSIHPPKLFITSSSTSGSTVPESTPSLPAGSFVAIEDATVKKESPSTNFGNSPTLDVGSSPVKEIFLKFKVSGINSSISSAKVRLYAVKGTSNGPGIYSASSDWKESSITYNTKPLRGSKISGMGAIATNSFLEYDVSAVVKGNGTYSFILAAGAKVGAHFASRSEVNSPVLIINENSSPHSEPSETIVPRETNSDPIVFKTINYSSPETDVNGQHWSTNQNAMLSHSVQKSQNGNIYRFEVNEGEQKASDTPGKNERSELQHRTLYPFGSDVWLSYSMKINPGEVVDSRWVIMGQMHSGNGSPPLSFNLSRDLFTIETLNGTVGVDTHKTIRSSMQFERGRWYNIVVRARFGLNKSASLQVWINGKQLENAANFDMGYTNDKGSTYWKFGVYRKTHPANQSIEYANMEIGTESLLQRVTNPKPIIP